MQKIKLFLSGVVFLLVTAVLLFSCGKDDHPSKPTVSFVGSTKTANEGDAPFDITVKLNKAASGNVTLYIETSGEAADTFDYDLVKKVVIPAGQTSATVTFTPYVDADFDPNEDAVISFAAVSTNATLNQSDYTVTLTEFPNEVRVDLTWAVDSGATPGDVDLDLLLWQYDQGNAVYNFLVASDQAGTGFEKIMIPTALLEDGNYGFSFLYWDGSSNNVDFKVKFTPLGTTSVEGGNSALEFTANYTSANLFDGSPQIEQEASILAADINSITPITVPGSGSRLNNNKAASGWSKSQSVKAFRYQIK